MRTDTARSGTAEAATLLDGPEAASQVEETVAPGRAAWTGKLLFPLSWPVLLGIWYVLTDVVELPSYVLPSIPATFRAFYVGVIERAFEPSGLLMPLLASLRAAAWGYVIGVGAAFVIGSSMAEIGLARRVMMPYVVALQTLPKVALAPLVIIWFGFGSASKIALAALVCFFPILIAIFTGLSSADRDQIELFRSMKASGWQVFRYVKLPTAAPMIFAGLDMGIVYSLIGTIVAEFVGAQEGIGLSIIQMRFVNDTSGVFAALFLLAITGIALHAIVRAVENRVIYWTEMQGGTRLT